jgi:hypothetical protein
VTTWRDKPVFPIGGPTNSTQRPAMIPLAKTTYLFHDVGSTGWGKIRNIHKHKGDKVEGNFGHLHSKFYDEAVDGELDA